MAKTTLGGVSIHSEHPFLPAAGDRDPLRRFRGRMAAPVTVWTAGVGRSRTGWTVSSVLVADGAPAELLGLLDPEADLAAVLAPGTAMVVNLLGWAHRQLGDAFAGTAPAPGGPFRLAEFSDTPWGPALVGGPGWLGVRIGAAAEPAGWSELVRGTVEHVEVGEGAGPALTHVRGRYHVLEP